MKLSVLKLVHGVAHAKFINASFAYAKPRQIMRFNPSDRGAWYAGLAVETCIAEVGFHLTQALADASDFNAVVEYPRHSRYEGMLLGGLRTHRRANIPLKQVHEREQVGHCCRRNQLRRKRLWREPSIERLH